MKANYLRRMMIIAGGYFLSGKLGLLLAIPPGYATVVWPASGIALAGVLLFGYRVWPGIVLGSFCINITTAFDPTTTASILKSLSLAISIGVGAALQAIFGAFLIHWTVGFPDALDKVKEVVKFLILGSAVACLVNATWSVTSLLVAGAISEAHYPFNWFTWWVGNTIGVLIFTPMILIWKAEPREVWRRRRASVGLPLCLAFAVSMMIFIYVTRSEETRIKLEFDRRAITLGQTIRNSLENYLEVLRSIESFYASSPEVSRQDFRTFVQRPYIRHPGIQALEWIPRLGDAQRVAYETVARQDGYADFQITERKSQGQMARAERRAEYFPVYYVEPYEGNEVALGFDLASNPTRLEALNRSRDIGKAVATARITLVQETSRQFAFLVFLPIYKGGLLNDMVELRRQNLRGFALGVFRIGDIVTASLKNLDREGIVVEIYDEMALPQERLLHRDRSEVYETMDSSMEDLQGQNPNELHWVTRFEVAERQLALRLSLLPEYVAAQRTWYAELVQVGGILFIGLLGTFLLVFTGRAARIEQLVEERTTELSWANEDLARSNTELERFAYVASHDLREPLRMISSYVQLLEKRYKNQFDAKGREFVAYASEGAARMSQLLDDLLQFSRVEKQEAFTSVDCNVILDQVLESLQEAIQKSDSVVTHDFLPVVIVDEKQLAQMFWNLIDNAIKFRGDDPPRIQVTAEQKVGEWVFAVKDNGIGIDSEYFERIFIIFQRLNHREGYPGNGVGLALCKKVVEYHGGRIWVESQIGQGATFYFTLPIKEVKDEQSTARETG